MTYVHRRQHALVKKRLLWNIPLTKTERVLVQPPGQNLEQFAVFRMWHFLKRENYGLLLRRGNLYMRTPDLWKMTAE